MNLLNLHKFCLCSVLPVTTRNGSLFASVEPVDSSPVTAEVRVGKEFFGLLKHLVLRFNSCLSFTPIQCAERIFAVVAS
ncbi:hypothetical protein MLD38_025458 [Melastoma candidum]|uniref:Uncharacterized protein n=1 Tax=Melastoma candidum TaxID=119954 RepID=A0ACB9NVF6_9MYRT|nr:hypothetical protein MLD38_025458 [Melastoma candidum]